MKPKKLTKEHTIVLKGVELQNNIEGYSKYENDVY